MTDQSTSLNDTSVMPTGVQGAYPGVMNVSTAANTDPEDVFATGGTLTGHSGVPTESGYEHTVSKKVNDSVEGKPGIIEDAELAPLGEGKVAADPGLASKATSMAKSAYDSVTGSK